LSERVRGGIAPSSSIPARVTRRFAISTCKAVRERTAAGSAALAPGCDATDDGVDDRYVGVQSVESAIQKVEAAGGKVVTPKTPIPGMGAYARIADTEGNILGLFEGQ
jgi:predicted enzyme related to lactoylglutathione lyase